MLGREAAAICGDGFYAAGYYFALLEAEGGGGVGGCEVDGDVDGGAELGGWVRERGTTRRSINQPIRSVHFEILF